MSDDQKSNGTPSRECARGFSGTRTQASRFSIHRPWFGLRACALLAAGGVLAVIWLTSENPHQLLQEAKNAIGKNPAQAEQLLERCLAARPDFPEAQLLRCRVLGTLGYWEEAYGMFHMIKRPNELTGTALLEFARQAKDAGQLSLAQVVAEAACRWELSRIPATQMLLEVCLQQGLQDRAIEASRELTKLTPDEPLPWQVMAVIYQDQKQSAKAVESYRMALCRQKNVREQHQIRVHLAQCLLDQGDIAAARETILPLLSQSASSTDALLLEATVLRFEGRTAEAIETVQLIFERHANLVPAIYLRGLLYFDDGRFEAARDDLVKVTQLDPRRGEAHYKLAQTYQRLGNTAEMEAELMISQKITDDVAELGVLKYRISQGAKDETTLQRFRQLSRLTVTRSASECEP
jgi:Tfp pilus assembly protein PilF